MKGKKGFGIPRYSCDSFSSSKRPPFYQKVDTKKPSR